MNAIKLEDVLFPDEKDPQVIEDNLRALCDDSQESSHYVKYFTDDELTDAEIELSGFTKEIYSKELEIEKMTEKYISPLKTELKKLKTDQREQLRLIDKGGYDAEGALYEFYDRENNKVKIYDNTGYIYGVRAMTLAERNQALQVFKVQNSNK